jgi:hypothetical protein
MNKEIIEKFDIKIEEINGKCIVSYIIPTRVDHGGIVSIKDRMYIREDFITKEEALSKAIEYLPRVYS